MKSYSECDRSELVSEDDANTSSNTSWSDKQFFLMRISIFVNGDSLHDFSIENMLKMLVPTYICACYLIEVNLVIDECIFF